MATFGEGWPLHLEHIRLSIRPVQMLSLVRSPKRSDERSDLVKVIVGQVARYPGGSVINADQHLRDRPHPSHGDAAGLAADLQWLVLLIANGLADPCSAALLHRGGTRDGWTRSRAVRPEPMPDATGICTP